VNFRVHTTAQADNWLWIREQSNTSSQSASHSEATGLWQASEQAGIPAGTLSGVSSRARFGLFPTSRLAQYITGLVPTTWDHEISDGFRSFKFSSSNYQMSLKSSGSVHVLPKVPTNLLSAKKCESKNTQILVQNHGTSLIVLLGTKTLQYWKQEHRNI